MINQGAGISHFPFLTYFICGIFFGGMGIIALIDKLIPSYENPHEIRRVEEIDSRPSELDKKNKLMRMGIFTSLAIGIHNFPEGLATFLAALQNPRLGAAIAVAVALHNIPEGISVSVPIFYATGNRGKAFCYSVLSGLAEPVGAVIAYVALRVFAGGEEGVIPPQVMGILFGGVAGIMVYISLDELLPTARQFGKSHEVIAGITAGIAIMAGSLLLLSTGGARS